MAYNRTSSTNAGTTARLTLLCKATSALALATGLALGASGTAQAQSVGAYAGNPTVASGNVSINRNVNTDNIRVDSNQAVINWTTTDTAIGGGPINFLPAGNTANYTNNPTAQNQFTVLNRIIPTDPTRAISLNGNVISSLQTGAGVVPGGNVWFYSPGGIIVGATGVIDVGGTVLTSADPVVDGAGNFIDAGGSFSFNPSVSGRGVTVNAGGQILATPQNSYVAIVAPVVTQRGTINVNGSALLVAADAATITFGVGGLFDIEVTVGTNGDGFFSSLIHSGTTTGPASTGAGDVHRIYAVTVPRNNAVFLAIQNGSNIGFDIAGAADVDGNAIVLSSGYNIFDGQIASGAVNPAQQSVLVIGTDSNISSAVDGQAVTQVDVSNTAGTIDFASDVRLASPGSVRVLASTTGRIDIAGDLEVSGDRSATAAAQAVSGGPVQLSAQSGGIITVGGNVLASANGQGGDNTTGSAGAGTGGTVQLYAQSGGIFTVGGDVLVSANGQGGNNTTGSAGAGTGGTADIRSFGNSLLQIDGNLTAQATGSGGFTSGPAIGGANGTGGTVIITSGRNATVDNNSTMTIGGDLFANANGFGSGSAIGVGGIGRGGSIQINSGSGTGSVSSNNVLTIGGSVLSNSDGFGGDALTGGTGGAGFGGSSNAITAGIGGQVDIVGDANLTSFGFGGSVESSGSGGAGTGGSASVLLIGAGGVVNIGADLVVQATGSGGGGLETGSVGGLGRGGNASVSSGTVAGAITVQGFTQIDSLGLGGSGAQGGAGVGGLQASGGGAYVISNGPGTVTLNNGVGISAGGVGGEANLAGTGGSGSGTGGTAQIVATANGIINVTGFTDINANGAVFGTGLTGTDGGNGTGGNASISQNTGGRITITGDAFVAATGSGDANTGGGDGIAGNGTGGDVRIAVNNLNITITGNASVNASGFGGSNLGGLGGGTGTGGLANLGAGAGTLAIGGTGTALANGFGGNSSGTGSGGAGLGGQAIIGSIPGGIIQIAGPADASAQGFGGNASGAGNVGGLGDGGTAQLFANSGSVTVGGITTMNASAFGGSVNSDASSGAALGGAVSLLSQGTGQITLNQDTFLSAQALSGNVDSGAGNAAAATGGTVSINAFTAGSAIRVNARILADAIAGVGSAVTGTIGDALGGSALIDSASGTVAVTGNVSLDATAFGGASTLTGNGGNATGGRTAVVVGGAGGATIDLGGSLTLVSNAFAGTAQTGNGGAGIGGLSEAGTVGPVATFTFGGLVSMSANGNGADAIVAGNGGAGTGGTSRFGANNAQMTGGDVFISAIGSGGDGALGGLGGNATGGFASMIAGTGTVIGLIDFGNAFLFADAFGGAGGEGATGAAGGPGGAGGNAIGGSTDAFASARNGQLDIINLQVSMSGFGGLGGAGGLGTSGVGGNGGAGGSGTGGDTQIGTISNTITTGPNPTPTGFMTMADAFVEASGTGGTGGDGGIGSAGNGNGGNGGLGDAGDLFFATRGSLVEVNALTLIANGNGGAGGNGTIGGNGGDGIGGTIGVESTEQFMAPTNRGTLVARDIVAIARGAGGTGTANGVGFYETGSFFRAVNGDVDANSIVYNLGNVGDLPAPTTIVEDFVRISDGAVNVDSSFTFITANSLSALVNNGSLTASSVGLFAGTFVPDTVITAPANIGTITADALELQSNGNLIATANLGVVQDIAIAVPGSVILGNITGSGVIGISGADLTLGNLVSGNHINLTSTSGAITAGTLAASNFIQMSAANGLTLGLATADTGFIDLLVLAGDLTVGNLSAGTYIALETDAGNIVIGDSQSGEETELDAAGAIQFANANAGLDFLATSTGDISGGDVTSLGALSDTTYSIGLLSEAGNITVGNLTGTRNIGFLSPGTITAGSLTSNENIIALGVGDIQFDGPVTTGTGATDYFYVGNASMSALLDAEFNPAPLFGVTPVRTAGSLTVGGAIQAGNILAGVGTALDVSQPINASQIIDLSAGSIATGALASGSSSFISSTSSINTGDIQSGGRLVILGATDVQTGSVNVASGIVDITGGSITTNSIAAIEDIFLFSDTGNIITGNLLTNGFVLLDAGVGSIQTGNIAADVDVEIRAAQSVTTGDIVASGIFTSFVTSIAIDTVAGDISTGNLTGSGPIGLVARGSGGTSGSVTTGNITTTSDILVLSSANILTGALTSTAGSTGTVFIGNSSAIPATTQLATFDFNSLLATTPVRTAGSLTVGGAIQAGNLLVGVGTAFDVNGAIAASGSRIGITANSITAQAINGAIPTAASLTATNGNLAVSTISTGGPVNLQATNGNITGGALSSGSPLTLLASTGTITTGLLSGTQVNLDAQGAVSIGGVSSVGAANLRSIAGSFTSTGAVTASTVGIGGVGVTLGNVTGTTGQISLNASTGNLSFATLRSASNNPGNPAAFIQFSAGGSVTGGDIISGSWIGTAVGGNMTLGNLQSAGTGVSPNGFSIGLGATGAIVTGTINSSGLLGIGSDDGQGNLGNAGSITTGAITAGGSVLLRSNQGLTTGAVSSTNEIRLRGGTVTTGTLNATNAILAAAMTGFLGTGNITTGTSAVLLAADSVGASAISTGTSGTTFIGNSSAIPATGLISTINLNTLLATTPVRVGGSIIIEGPVTTGTLVAASNNGFSANDAITAGTRIAIDTGGTADFGELAVAPTIAISSQDIELGESGALGNANTSTLTLTNSNDGEIFIGGTTPIEAYLLDASELSRLRAGNITISSPMAGTSGVGIEIRSFTLNGSAATSGVNLNGPEGSLTIQTTSTIRVNGNAIFNAMAPTNRVALNARTVEINADTGSLILNGSSPGGTLAITANNVHIASSSILEQLAANVNFAGRDAALDQPLATSRPDGVIQASTLQFNVRDTLLIQNTGSLTLDAGFFGRVGTVQITPRGDGTPLDMVIYGQLLDTGDIVRNGTSVRDLIFPRSSSSPDSGVTGFTANSSVNGCLVNAVACGGGSVTEQGPTAVVHAGPPPPEPAAEREAEREQEEAEAAAEEAARGEAAPRRPIMPPVTIVNTRSLGIEPIIDEPVTSGGNPNLQLDQPLLVPLPDTGGQP